MKVLASIIIVFLSLQEMPVEAPEKKKEYIPPPPRVVVKKCWSRVTERVAKTYTFTLCERDLAEEKPWDGFEDSGPPLGLWNAVGLARAELSKYTTKPRVWTVSSVLLEQVLDTAWVYVVEFKTSHWGGPDTLAIPVLLSGTPIEAKVEPRASPSD